MQLKKRRIFLALVLLLLVSVQPCAADLVESRQTLPFDLDSIRYIEYAPVSYPFPPPHLQSQTLHFAAFDSSLGTLKNAYLSYEGTYGIEYGVKAGVRKLTFWEDFWNGTYWGDVSGWAAYQYAFGLNAPGVGNPIESIIHSGQMTTETHGLAWGDYETALAHVNIDGSGPKDLLGDNTPDGKYMFQPWVTSGDLDTPILSLSNGLNVSGGAVDVVLEKEIALFMLPFFSSFVDPEYSYVDNYLNKWSGNIALTYVYETDSPVPTPEPGSLLLVCASLLGLAGVRRKYRYGRCSINGGV
jgi:hypothetical protein